MKALVLLSGGMDSAMALLWARRAYEVEAVSIHYGQQHFAELGAAWDITKALGVPYESLEMTTFSSIAPSRLTGRAGGTFVVPNRNAFLLSVAGAVAMARGIEAIVIGCNGDDAADFPDCRPAFVESMQSSLRLASGREFTVMAPWLHMSKADAFKAVAWTGQELALIQRSVSCYMGKRPGCGTCPACVKRSAAFAASDLEEVA